MMNARNEGTRDPAHLCCGTEGEFLEDVEAVCTGPQDVCQNFQVNLSLFESWTHTMNRILIENQGHHSMSHRIVQFRWRLI